MSKLTLLLAAMALATWANTHAQPDASLETELPQLVAACNGAANSSKGRVVRACENLEKQGRLSLVEPAAVTAYQRYQDELQRWQACQRGQIAVPPASRMLCPRMRSAVPPAGETPSTSSPAPAQNRLPRRR